MSENSKISWTDDTFNPWAGCEKVSPACDHCYAEGWAKRAGCPQLWTGAPPRRTTAANWRQPVKWNRQAQENGIRRRVFCASLADVFDERVSEFWRVDLWNLIEATPNLDWLILTKRPENIKGMYTCIFPNGIKNVWLGVTVENQLEAERRIRILQNAPAVIRFLSCEPLLEPIAPNLDGIHWTICGGESGGNARLMNDDWARQLRDQCKAKGVAFFMKQMGAVSDRISKGSGIERNEEWGYIPQGLRVRDFPGYGGNS